MMSTTIAPFFELQTLFTRHQRGVWDCQYRVPKCLLVSKKGTVFAFPEERLSSTADYAKNNLVLRRSADHGRTWTEIQVLRSDENPRVSYGLAAGVSDEQTGRIMAFYYVSVPIFPEDIGGQWPEKWGIEHPEQAAMLRNTLAPHLDQGLFLIWTDDEGEHWSAPRRLGDEVHVVNPVTGERRPFGLAYTGIQLHHGPYQGRLIVPGYGWSKDGAFDEYAYEHNYVVYSDDHGETWHAGGLAQNGTGEAGLVEEIDGTVYLNSRNESLRGRGYRAWDRSRDGGATFLESGYDLHLPEPHCHASITRYSEPPVDRSRILFCNPAVHSLAPSGYDHAGRRNLTVRISYDECRSWPVSRRVCEGTAGYSALAVARNNTILCAYETLTADSYTGDIILARFNLTWLTAMAGEPAVHR